ncbi:hypothetical protein EDD86DRAFT_198473 [Gorgonomyces haynaldii]|nr:hypothetical protein EDD86DRAFT_198473 [Gorgonomyces haynaldii]
MTTPESFTMPIDTLDPTTDFPMNSLRNKERTVVEDNTDWKSLLNQESLSLELTDKQLLEMCPYLPESSLLELNLSGNQLFLNESTMHTFGMHLCQSKVTHLDISDCDIEDHSILTLYIQQSTVKSLKVSGDLVRGQLETLTSFWCADLDLIVNVDVLTSGLQHLRHLSLYFDTCQSDERLEDKLISQFLNALQASRLESLVLSGLVPRYNLYQHRDWLCSIVCIPGLLQLDLSHNALQSSVSRFPSGFGDLQELCLIDNHLTDRNIRCLKEKLLDSGANILDMSQNQIHTLDLTIIL